MIVQSDIERIAEAVALRLQGTERSKKAHPATTPNWEAIAREIAIRARVPITEFEQVIERHGGRRGS